MCMYTITRMLLIMQLHIKCVLERGFTQYNKITSSPGMAKEDFSLKSNSEDTAADLILTFSLRSNISLSYDIVSQIGHL